MHFMDTPMLTDSDTIGIAVSIVSERILASDIFRKMYIKVTLDSNYKTDMTY